MVYYVSLKEIVHIGREYINNYRYRGMKKIFVHRSVEVLLYEGKEHYGLGTTVNGIPYGYVYDPQIVSYDNIVKQVLEELYEGLEDDIVELLNIHTVYSTHRGIAYWLGLEIIRSLTRILIRDVKLRPLIPELGKRIKRIMRHEEVAEIRGSRVKKYDHLYSFARVLEVAASIAELNGCQAIEIRAGMKKEYGPDLIIDTTSDEKIQIEVTVRRPGKHDTRLDKPIPLHELLVKALDLDLKTLRSKLEKQRRQLTQTQCLIIVTHYSTSGLASIIELANKNLGITSVKQLKGICLYPSWISNKPQSTLICINEVLTPLGTV